MSSLGLAFYDAPNPEQYLQLRDGQQPLFLHDEHGSPLLRYTYYPAEELMHAQWHSNLTTDAVIFGGHTTLLLAQQLKYRWLLNDISLATGDWTEALDWLEFEWLPQAQEYGLRACAHVFTPSMYNQFVTQEYLTRLQAYLPIQSFTELEAAQAWLHGQQ
ncbi:hypothetical protein GCM10022408_19860 [Hymenobacter fastidiosus]|uniref:STAS/SEC14 domain-containing protein n=1 Tax=Hymenobacter fastidiosus TaxID=486264 RepID=A0ABP7S7R4_9BACT